jgi:hypothetical protein
LLSRGRSCQSGSGSGPTSVVQFEDWYYSLRLINGPRSLADNNLYAPINQTTHFDSARAGQWDNGQGFIGISNSTYGTLTVGRTTLLSQSAIGSYDPVASVAFSQIGFSALYATFGASPTSRINTAVTYRLTYQDFRIAAQAQIGGSTRAMPRAANIRPRLEQTSARSPLTRSLDTHRTP